MSDNRAITLGLLAVLGWSTVATAFKVALDLVDTFQLLFYSNLTAALLLATFTLWRQSADKVLESFVDHWQITLAAGALNPFIYYLLLFEAYDRLPAQVAMSINYTWAIVLTFMAAVFLRQKIRLFDYVAALVCYAGVVVIATGGRFDSLDGTSPLGLTLAVASTLIWAGYWIINVRDEREPELGLMLNFLVALPLTGIMCLLFSSLPVTYTGLAASAYVGLVEMAAGFLLWSMALKMASNASRVSNLIFLSPFASLVFIFLVLGELILPSTFIGLALIISALLAQQCFHGRALALKSGGLPQNTRT